MSTIEAFSIGRPPLKRSERPFAASISTLPGPSSTKDFTANGRSAQKSSPNVSRGDRRLQSRAHCRKLHLHHLHVAGDGHKRLISAARAASRGALRHPCQQGLRRHRLRDVADDIGVEQLAHQISTLRPASRGRLRSRSALTCGERRSAARMPPFFGCSPAMV